MNKRAMLLLCAAACLAACGKTEAPVPADGQPADAASRVGVSTSGVVGQTLNAPGKYARNLAGSLDRAKSTADMVNRQAAEREAQDEQYKTGGN